MKLNKKAILVTLTICVVTLVPFTFCRKKAEQDNSQEMHNAEALPGSAALRTNGVEILTDNSTYFEADYELNGEILFTYKAETVSSEVTETTLKIKRSSTDSIELVYIEEEGPGSRYNEHNKVVAISEQIKDEFTAPEIITLSDAFLNFVTGAMNGATNSSARKVQCLLYYNAILETTERSIALQTNCECTPIPMFFDGYSTFWCQEDMMVNKALLLSVWDSISVPSHEDSLMYIFASNQTGSEFSFKNLYASAYQISTYLEGLDDLYTHFQNNPEPSDSPPCPWGLGSDLGCCGNYTGCCWYRHFICWYHDVMCMYCPQPYCGPDCIIGLKTRDL